MGLFLLSDAAKGYCLPSALEDPTPRPSCSSLSQHDWITYLGSLTYSSIGLCFFFLWPSNPSPIFFVELKQPETERLEHRLIWSQASERVRDREKGRRRQKGKMETERRESEKVKDLEIYEPSPLEERLGLNQHVSVFILPSFAVPPSAKKQIAKEKSRQRQEDRERNGAIHLNLTYNLKFSTVSEHFCSAFHGLGPLLPIKKFWIDSDDSTAYNVMLGCFHIFFRVSTYFGKCSVC